MADLSIIAMVPQPPRMEMPETAQALFTIWLGLPLLVTLGIAVRNLLTGRGPLLLLCVIGIALYRGWFVLTSSSRDESNKVDVNLTVDPDKAKEDAHEVMDKTRELGDRARDTVK